MSATNVRSLYEIDAELGALLAAMEEDENYPEDLKREALDTWLGDTRGEIEEKIDNYCAVIRSREVHAKGIVEEIKSLQKMLRADDNTVALLKDRALAFFEHAGIDKMQTRRFWPRVQVNGGKQSVKLTEAVANNPYLLPTDFQRYEVTPDMELIRQTLEEGHELDFATLEPRGTHLRLR